MTNAYLAHLWKVNTSFNVLAYYHLRTSRNIKQMLGKHDWQESFWIFISRDIDTILIPLKSSKINASSQKVGHKVKNQI